MPKAIRIERESHPGTRRKPVDLKLGYALLCDRRVPLRCKAAAFAIGLAAICILGILELPLEEIIAAVFPLIGVLGDFSIDGVEAVLGPIIIACLTLPYLAPAAVVDQVRRERNPVPSSHEPPIIDV